MSQIEYEESREDEDLFEPLDLTDAIDFWKDTSDKSYNYDNGSFSRPPRIRRSRSATNMMLDANNAFGELLKFHDLEDEGEDPFEPLPINASIDEDLDLDMFRNLNHELNNQKKKRGRRRSLLRRSNSFESLFDKKKVFKNLDEGFPTRTSTRTSKRLPSFIQSHDYSLPREYDPCGSSPNSPSAFPEFVSSVSPNVQTSEILVPTFQGMDVVLQDDRKTLSRMPGVKGNSRLQILLNLEIGRFRMLSPAEQQKTATDLLMTITEKWRGRVLVENGSSYVCLCHKGATDAMRSLLLGGNNFGARKSQAPSMGRTSYMSTSKPPNSLLAAAPPLPDFLRNASKEILSSSRKRYTSEMSSRERQAAAINALKERNKARQLAKQKAKEQAA